MKGEREVNRSVRVFVPLESYDELLSKGSRGTIESMIHLHMREVAQFLLFNRKIKRGDSLSISFVPTRNLRDLDRRTIKFITAYKNEEGYVTNAFVEWLDFESSLPFEN